LTKSTSLTVMTSSCRLLMGSFLFLLAVIVALPAGAFTIPGSSSSSSRMGVSQHKTIATALAYAPRDDERPIQCFLIDPPKQKRRRKKTNHNNHGINDHPITPAAEVDDDSVPRIVCTSAPDEYAHHNGLTPDVMHSVSYDVLDHASLCAQGASPRGVPEWEFEPHWAWKWY